MDNITKKQFTLHWEPKTNITTYELAQAIPFITKHTTDNIDMTKSFTRHFKVVDNDGTIYEYMVPAKKLKTVEEYNRCKLDEHNKSNTRLPRKTYVGVECPNCGKEMYKYSGYVMASNPPKVYAKCDCGNSSIIYH